MSSDPRGEKVVVVRNPAGRSFQGEGNYKHKGPEVGNVEACFKHRKDTYVAGVWQMRVEWDVGERWAGAKSHGTQ